MHTYENLYVHVSVCVPVHVCECVCEQHRNSDTRLQTRWERAKIAETKATPHRPIEIVNKPCACMYVLARCVSVCFIKYSWEKAFQLPVPVWKYECVCSACLYCCVYVRVSVQVFSTRMHCALTFNMWKNGYSIDRMAMHRKAKYYRSNSDRNMLKCISQRVTTPTATIDHSHINSLCSTPMYWWNF